MRLFLMPFLCAVAVGALATAAGATGTTRVTQKDGKVQEYPGTRFTVAGHALTLVSPDGKGALRIAIVNCVKTGEIHRCEPGGAEYLENGQIRALDITSGSLYFNTTGEKQTMSYSSTQIPPYGVIMTVQTAKGTFISATASIDGLKK
jgi:hypothetical protein